MTSSIYFSGWRILREKNNEQATQKYDYELEGDENCIATTEHAEVSKKSHVFKRPFPSTTDVTETTTKQSKFRP